MGIRVTLRSLLISCCPASAHRKYGAASTARTSAPNNSDQRHRIHHQQSVNSCLHSRNSFVSTSQPLLCKPTEACVAKWQEQWDATQSNRKKYDVHPKERLPSGHTLLLRTWRTSNRVRSGQAASVTSVGLPGEQNLCVLHGHMRSRPHYDELPTWATELTI